MARGSSAANLRRRGRPVKKEMALDEAGGRAHMLEAPFTSFVCEGVLMDVAGCVCWHKVLSQSFADADDVNHPPWLHRRG